MKEMIKEDLTSGSNITTSSVSPAKPLREPSLKKATGSKYVLSFDMLRCIAYGVSPGVFEIVSYYLLGEPNHEEKYLMSRIDKEPVQELEPGSYKAERIDGKR